MPTCRVLVTCEECSQALLDIDLNTHFLAAVLCKARRDHAIDVHGWQLAERAAQAEAE